MTNLSARLLTEHVLQPDDAGEIIVEVDFEIIIPKPQCYQLKELVINLHPFE